MLSNNQLIASFIATGLLGTILPPSPSYSNPNFDKESNYLNNVDSLTKNNKSDTYLPKDKLDEYIIKGATYSRKFIPLINDGSKGSEYTNIMSRDLNK